MFVGSFSVDSGYQLMKQAVEQLGDLLPTAFLVGSDTMAVGCLRALHELGIAVPNRVSMIGVNDMTIEYTYPSLSSLKVYTEIMGETAVDALLERMDGRNIGKRIYVATELILRGSVV
ncbi:substrate-binding domain-containing protein [Virgibacillus sp. 179-BFC.A HS]|uniref:Substrate-binding domain-containing protein n=1 Tax=Tigheibacillus jepli TaxID=3035914 RepID=A0ABU5CGY1_9BACI|nr:substrate-binding domain-containing protein [Virgibacillus sp. 179-BFC.A HS]MDY0404813.1 substrate-binding domain-containing protein [Virgibacillus sp. 179-BFC.A HS]